VRLTGFSVILEEIIGKNCIEETFYNLYNAEILYMLLIILG